MLTESVRIARMNAPLGRIPLVIDSDTRNEVDDQFAIAWAAASKDRFDLQAVYAVPFSHDCWAAFDQDRQQAESAGKLVGHAEDPADGMRQSYDEIIRILRLMNEPVEGRVFYGSDRYLSENDPYIESDAAYDLIRRAMHSEEPLYVAAIGALTNIASALQMEPRIAEHIVVLWLGGHELDFGHGIEFNLVQDVRAAQILFDSGVPLIWVPCFNVASQLTVTAPELREHMLGHGPVSDYLAQTVLSTFKDTSAVVAMMNVRRHRALSRNSDQTDAYLAAFPTTALAPSRIIWDISTIAALKNPNWTPSMLIPAPVLNDDFSWSAPREGRHCIRVVTTLWRDMIFGDLFATLNGR